MTVDARHAATDLGDHVVQFYERDADLVAAVGQYLAVAIDAGGVALAIATETHRKAFEHQLVAAGVDVADARHRGQLVLLDAATMMSTFVTPGRVDGDAFRTVIGRLIGEAAKKGRPVRVYGEMVALLWDRGDVLGAVLLESMWNDLGATSFFPFSLYCAYHAESVAGSEHAEALQRLCHLHSTVMAAPSDGQMERPAMSGYEVTADFAAKATAPRAVRHVVVDTLSRWHLDHDLIDHAALVSSEMAANAVVHARSSFSVTLRAGEGLVRIEVRDTRPAADGDLPRLVARPGRGLGVVAALSQRWGVDAADTGKTVWAEFSDTEMVPPREGSHRVRKA
jgi:anti-sigma regulatory factor (Ser/Thr protein kinase)